MFGTKRFWLSLLLVMLLCFVSLSSVAASDQSAEVSVPSGGIVRILSTNISQIAVELNLNGSTATCSAYVLGVSGTDEVAATVRLKRRNGDGTYSTVALWPGLHAYGRVLTFSDTVSVATGYTYQLSITATVYKDGSSETKTVYDYDSN